MTSFQRAFLAFVLIASSFVPKAHAQTSGALDLPPLVKKARSAVVMIIVYDKNGDEFATGTGFFVTSSGVLITNHHVIAGGDRATAKAEDGKQFLVLGVLAEDADADLAVLRIEGSGFPTLNLGASEGVEPGTRIAVIGSPYGFENSISEGIISAVRKFPGEKQRKLQITAPVSPGSSGSPVLNEKGEVIGVATLIHDGQAINFAVPVEDVRAMITRAKSAMKMTAVADVKETADEEIDEDADYIASLQPVTADNKKDLLKHAQAAVKRFPKNYLAYQALGMAFETLERKPDAIAAYKKAAELGPRYADVWHSLGIIYESENKTADALAAYQKAIELNPDFIEAWSALGNAYLQANRFPDAVAAFQKTITLEPDNEDGLVGLAKAFHLKGEQAKAREAWQQLRSYHPIRAEKVAGELK